MHLKTVIIDCISDQALSIGDMVVAEDQPVLFEEADEPQRIVGFDFRQHTAPAGIVVEILPHAYRVMVRGHIDYAPDA